MGPPTSCSGSRRGEAITAVKGVVITTSPGRVEFREPVDLTTRSGTLRVEPGETLYPLTYRSEGHTQAWFKGEIYEDIDGGYAFFNELCRTEQLRCVGTIVERPQSTWWVQVRNDRGQRGWIRNPEKFDGPSILDGPPVLEL